MVYEKEVAVIVMLSLLEEDGKVRERMDMFSIPTCKWFVSNESEGMDMGAKKFHSYPVDNHAGM